MACRKTWVVLAIMVLGGALVCAGAFAQETQGIRLNRFGMKDPATLAQKAGGPTERIEIQSTTDNRDFVVKVYLLKNANASEVFELIQAAVALEGGNVSRIAPGSVCELLDGDGTKCRTEYTGQSLLVVTEGPSRLGHGHGRGVRPDQAPAALRGRRADRRNRGEPLLHPRARRPAPAPLRGGHAELLRG